MLVVIPIPSHTAITSALAYLMEQTYAKHVPVSIAGSQNSKTLSYSLDVAETQPRVDANVPVSYMLEYRNSVSAAAGFPLGWQVTVYEQSGATTTINCELNVEVIFDVVFTDPDDTLPSLSRVKKSKLTAVSPSRSDADYEYVRIPKSRDS